MLFLNVLFDLLTLFAFGDNEKEKLEFVVVVYRHGHRSPVQVYPNDPFNNESYWPDGWGQITNFGKLEQYKLGKWLRNRYRGFLPEKYNRNDIYIRSTDVDRTLMSAYCTLAGLYEPHKNNWHRGIKWQPIPVHTVPENLDPVLAMAKECQTYENLLKLAEDSLEVEEFKKRFANEIGNITYHSGMNLKCLSNIIRINSILQIESKRGCLLPDWTNDYYPQPLAEMAGFVFRIPCLTVQMRRLKCGPLLKEILDHMNGKVKGELTQKMWMYSGHDNTLVNLMMCLDNFDNHVPDFSDMVILELLKKGNTYHVSVLYKNEKKLKVLKIPRCRRPCSLEKFEEVLKPVLPKDWEAECKRNLQS